MRFVTTTTAAVLLWLAFGSAATAQISCSRWNKIDFIILATMDDVTSCVAAGHSVAARDKHGSTVLHRAAALNKSPAVIAALLKAGARLEARNKFGHTPLHMAAMFSHASAVISVLLNAGANSKARDEEGKLPWDYAKENPALKGTDVYWRLNEARFR